MNQILDFLSSLSIFVTPFVLGSVFGGNIVSRFLKGALVVMGAFFIASIVSGIVPFLLTLQVVLIGGLIAGFTQMIWRREWKVTTQFFKHVSWQHLLGGIVTIFLAWYAFFWLFKALTPYPYSVNWDVFEHVTLAENLLAGNVSLFPSHITDTFTFNGYTPLFHVLLAIPTALFHASLLGVYYYAEWWFYLLTVISTMYLSYTIFRTRTAVIVAGILAVFSFASTVVYMPLFLLPQTLTALIGVLFLLRVNNITKKNWFEVAIICISLLMLHGVIGTVIVGIFILWCFYAHIEENSHSKLVSQIGLWGSFAVLLLALLLHVTGGIHLTGREEALYYQLSLSQLTSFFATWYGILGIVLAPIGVYSLWITNNSYKRQVVIIGLGLLALAVSPFSYALKFFSLGWFFLLFMLVAAVEFLLTHIPYKLRFIPLVCIFIAYLFIYYGNEIQYKQFLYHNGKESHISSEELRAATFIRSQGQHTFLISDPATQGVMEALAESNSQGGVYMNLSSRQILATVKENEGENIASILSQIDDTLSVERNTEEKRFFIASGRYFAWQNFPKEQKESVYFNVWIPQTLSAEDQVFIDEYKEVGMKEVYHNSEMSIFEL